MTKPFRIMKGDPVDPKHLRYPLYVFPKFNGFRGYIKDGVVYTASNKPFKNRAMQEAFGRPEYEGLDGEFVVGDPSDGDNSLNRTSSVVTRVDGDISDLQFFVFDHIGDLDAPYHARFFSVYDRFEPIDTDTRDRVMVSPMVVAHSWEDVAALERGYVSQGWEGVVTRDPEALYKCGRSTAREAYMGKLKQFIDAEFEIIGFEERMHNTNEATVNERGLTQRSSAQAGKVGRGDLGALICRTKEGHTFNVGTGFNDAQRAELWAVRHELTGQLAKVKYHAVGSHEVPVLPVFLQIRPAEDMTP